MASEKVKEGRWRFVVGVVDVVDFDVVDHVLEGEVVGEVDGDLVLLVGPGSGFGCN